MNLPDQVEQYTVKKGVPFAQSAFWQQQRDFYCCQGIEAWVDKVPYYVTNNTFLAEGYFQNIVCFWLESFSLGLFTKEEPFYILEFGAGPGLFSFYLLQRLYQWWEEMQPGFSFIYIMSDLAASNMDFWKAHPALQPYVEKGVLDFAVWDAESAEPLITDIQGIRLSTDNPSPNVLVAVANYVLDSLRHELMRLEKGKLFRGWLTEEYESEKAATVLEEDLQHLFANTRFLPFNTGELTDERNILNKVAANYGILQEQCDFFFPTGALTLLEHLRASSDREILLLITDKGTCRHRDLMLSFQPGVAWHHSISVDVPFDILKMWVMEAGGEAIITETSQVVQNAGFLLSNNIAAFPHTLQMLKCNFLNHASGTTYNAFRFYAEHQPRLSLTDIVACLNMTQWDPFVFDEFFPAFIQLIKAEQQNPFLLADCIDGLRKVSDQYYYLPGGGNTLANLGLIFQELGKFKLAIHYYQQSLIQFGNIEAVRFNIGICCMAIKEWNAAKEWMKTVIEENPENFTARGYLEYCSEHCQPKPT